MAEGEKKPTEGGDISSPMELGGQGTKPTVFLIWINTSKLVMQMFSPPGAYTGYGQIESVMPTNPDYLCSGVDGGV